MYTKIKYSSYTVYTVYVLYVCTVSLTLSNEKFCEIFVLPNLLCIISMYNVFFRIKPRSHSNNTPYIKKSNPQFDNATQHIFLICRF